MSETPSLLDFSDADLKATLRRAMKLTAAMAVFGFGVLGFLFGWKPGVQFLAGRGGVGHRIVRVATADRVDEREAR